MGERGPAPKPRLQVVKEGNPGKRPLRNDLKLPPYKPSEPKWAEVLPAADDEDRKAEVLLARRLASEAWRRIVRVLTDADLLSELDPDVIRDAAVCNAQLVIAGRDWSKRGSKALPVPRPSLTQLRADFARYASMLYLAPRWRVGIDIGGSRGDEDDPFD